MLHKLLLLFVISLTVCNGVIAQKLRNDLQKRQQRLFKEIDALNKQLEQTKDNEKDAMQSFTAIEKKIKAREELANNISSEISQLDGSISLNEKEINRLSGELDTLKINYAKSMVFGYKHRGSNHYLNFLFSATNFNDAIKRMAYLKSYRQYRTTQAETIIKTQNLLKQTKTTLTNNLNEKSAALTAHTTQLTALQQDKEKKDQVVKQLKDQEKELLAEINKREKEKRKLKNAIELAIRKEIEEENKREKLRLARLKAEEDEKKRLARAKEINEAKAARIKAANKPNTVKTKPVANDDVAAKGVAGTVKNSKENGSTFSSVADGSLASLNFKNNKGNLPWPISGGVVSGEFGLQQVTKNIKVVNDGIFIKTQVGSTVKAVADGQVLTIINLGDYKAVMIKHGDHYTTYNMIDDVTVSKKETVKAGTILGKVSPNLKGEGEFEFMVTNENGKYFNPRSWLRAK